jgi:hypothetical protein
VSEKIMVPRVGRQRTRRVVCFTLGPDGVRTSETLACGHKLEPPPRRQLKHRVCPSCEERLGRVTKRLGRDPSPAEVNLLDTAQIGLRTQIAKARRMIVELRRQLAIYRAADPFMPEVGKTIAGRTVVEINKATVTWAPARLLALRNGEARGIREKCRRGVAWTQLCQKPLEEPASRCVTCGR